MKTILLMNKKHSLHFLRFIVIFFSLSIAVSVCNVITIRLSGDIGQAAISSNVDDIKYYVLLMSFVMAIALIPGALTAYLKKRCEGKTDYILRNNFVKHFIHLPFLILSRKKSGEMLSLYTNERPNITSLFAKELPDVIGESTMMIICVAFMLAIQPLYTLVFLISYPILFFMQVYISKPIVKYAQAASKKRAEYNAVTVDNLQNTTTVISYGLENYMEQRFSKSYNEYYAATKKRIAVFTILIIFGIVATMIPLVILFAALARAVINGELRVGAFVAYTTIAVSSNSWLSMFSQRITQIRQEIVSIERVNEHMTDPKEEQSDTGKIAAVNNDKPAISFENVVFSYVDETNALDGLSFSVTSGECVGIVGASGCGKSTAVKFMLSLYDTDSGTVKIFDNDIKTHNKPELRRLVSYVPQDSFIFPDTIAENIRCSDNIQSVDDDMKKLREAASKAGILEFIDSQADGFNALLGESGDNISGGQRQRIAFARAFYRDAPIMLLDEATSALDAFTEQVVLNSLIENSRKTTTVIIAHRLSAVKNCDKIIVMEKGKVAEQGSFDELIKKGGLFTSLYEAQRKELQHEGVI